MLLLKASLFHKHRLMCFVHCPEDCCLSGLIQLRRFEKIPTVNVSIKKWKKPKGMQ